MGSSETTILMLASSIVSLLLLFSIGWGWHRRNR